MLEHLPAYSPNLNLIERFWKFLKEKALSRWHESFEAMQAAVASVVATARRLPQRVGNPHDRELPAMARRCLEPLIEQHNSN